MIKGFDHVAIPMGDVEAMLAFYGIIGDLLVEEVPGFLHSVYLGDNKINLHLPQAWQSPAFTLRAPDARPGCGDFCFVWQGSPASAIRLLESAGAAVEEGPVTRRGGRGDEGTSVYVRDPDQNLLEFIVYP